MRNLVLFVVVALAAGLGSARHMIDKGSALTTRRIGPWSTWTAAARADTDPYTRAHFARTGALPLSSAIARVYQADTDNAGRPLSSNCLYAVEGVGPDAGWWVLAVYTAKGKLIQNIAERHTFTKNTIVRQPDGSYTITLAREAHAGNWLPTGRGRLLLVLSVQQPRYVSQFGQDTNEAQELPTITRVSCR